MPSDSLLCLLAGPVPCWLSAEGLGSLLLVSISWAHRLLMRPALDREERVQDGGHSLSYFNLRSDIPLLLLYFIGCSDQPWDSTGGNYTKMWIVYKAGIIGAILEGLAMIGRHELQFLGGYILLGWPVTSSLASGRVSLMVYFMLQSSPWHFRLGLRLHLNQSCWFLAPSCSALSIPIPLPPKDFD